MSNVSSTLTVGQRIRKARRDKEYTQEELANKIGVTKATINKYESGLVTNIPRSKIEALAKALDMQPSDLFTYEETLDMYRQQMDETQKEIIRLEADIEEQRQAGRELEAITKELDTLNMKRADLAAKARAFEELLHRQYQVFLSYTNPKDVSPGLAELAAALTGPENKAEEQPAEIAKPKKHLNVVFRSDAKPEAYEKLIKTQVTAEEQELLRIYNKLPVRKRLELLNYAYSLEDEEK